MKKLLMLTLAGLFSLIAINSVSAQCCGLIEGAEVQLGLTLKASTIYMDTPLPQNKNNGFDGKMMGVQTSVSIPWVQVQLAYNKAIGDLQKDTELLVKNFWQSHVSVNIIGSLDWDVGPILGLGMGISGGDNINYNENLENTFTAIYYTGQLGVWVDIAETIKVKGGYTVDYFASDTPFDLVENGKNNDKIRSFFLALVGTF